MNALEHYMTVGRLAACHGERREADRRRGERRRGRPAKLPGDRLVPAMTGFLPAEYDAICRLASQSDLSVASQIRQLTLAALKRVLVASPDLIDPPRS